MHITRTTWIGTLLWLVPLAVGGQHAPTAPLQVLFIGNSYTSVNDLPALIVELAEAAGGRKIEVDRHLVGGCTLEKHFLDHKALDKIRSAPWDVVVLQEQSLRPAIDRQAMHPYARLLDAEIKQRGAKTVFYLTWARQQIPEMQAGADPATSPAYAQAMYEVSGAAKTTNFDTWCQQQKPGLAGGLNRAYFDIAQELGADVAPVGIAWQMALAAEPPFVLHKPDNSHPNPTGTYLAACVFYATLLEASPVGLPGTIRRGDEVLADIPRDQATRLQHIAWTAVRQPPEVETQTTRDNSGDRFTVAAEEPSADRPEQQRLAEYREELDRFRREYGGSRSLPDVRFFLFGMGPRAKLLYKSGALIDAISGKTLRQWPVKVETILPPDYGVFIETTDGRRIGIIEDEQAVWIEENGQRQAWAGTQEPLHLPAFDQHSYPRILRVLHQELLVNVIDGQPVPNYFVYPKPWYRDGAMMAMCFEATGNLDVIKDWVLNLSVPYDRNNAGETEADNLGQALYLISLVCDRHHPLVARILDELPKFEVQGPEGKYIQGRSDFAEHPAYQTKWAKYGLAALKLDDPYVVPRVQDSYSALFWWAYMDTYVAGQDAHDRGPYPYLGWACDHFHGRRQSPISDRDYPLTWEHRASQAKYEGMMLISEQYTQQRLAAPHTWHAAEVFLYLLQRPVQAPAGR